MPDFQIPKILQPHPEGPFQETLVDAIVTSIGADDAGKIPVLGADGRLDASVGGGGGGSGAPVWAGVYDPSTPYSTNMAVSSNGSSYISTIDNNIGNDPAASPTMWGLMAQAGIKGDQGDPGVAGAKGDPGVAGAKGDPGVAGAKGDPGVKGDTGVQGDPGSAGAKGDTGLTGAAGTNGVAGVKGDTGLTGAKGDPGVAGANGLPNTLTIGTVTSGTAAATITGNSPNQILNLILPSGGGTGGGTSRVTNTFVTQAVLDDQQTESNIWNNFGKSFAVIKLSVNVACRIRIYTTSVLCTADLSRLATVPPTAGTQHGVIFDLVLTDATGLSWLFSPLAVGSDGINPPTGNIAYNVTNLSGAANQIQTEIVYFLEES